MLNEAKLEVEIWHQDRLKNDLLVNLLLAFLYIKHFFP